MGEEKSVTKGVFTSIRIQYILVNLCIALLLFVSYYYFVFYLGINPLIFYFFFVFSVVVFRVFYVNNLILKPLTVLDDAASRMEHQDFDTLIEEQATGEFGHIYETINRTMLKLQELDVERKGLDEAKTQFLSIASHEIRSPLTPMKAQLEMLEQRYFGPLNPKQKESMNLILRNADRLDKIIDDMLEVSRIESARLSFTFVKTDLNKLVSEVVTYMKGFAKEKKVSFHLKAEKLPVIEADRDRIAQVLRNLIGNAIKFVPSEKGSIVVEVKPEGNTILFSVKDNGPGISKEDQLRLFEPFFQIDKVQTRRYGGAGLGLTISKGIVEAQKGKIWVESTLGQGSTFFFTFPLKPVHELKPVRLLFLGSEIRDKELEKVFVSMIGVVGKKEFHDLRVKGKTSKKEIIEYIEGLYNAGIIEKDTLQKFRDTVEDIFLREALNKGSHE